MDDPNNPYGWIDDKTGEVFPSNVNGVAILLYAANALAIGDCNNIDQALAYARGCFEAIITDEVWQDGKHYGDCTKQAVTCARCVVEEYEQQAREIWKDEKG